MSNEVRQAIVIVHGMGEQRPLETLKGFIDAALPGPPSELHSRPDKVTDSYEARRYLAERKPKNRNAQEIYAQTEVYEFHWAHMMQGNRLDDMWSTFRRVLFALPNQVPSVLRVVWALFWLGVALAVWAFWAGPLSDLGLLDVTGDEGIARVIRTLIGSSLITSALIYVITKMLPSWMTKNFVDVVRYLDTSARSYDARRDIRKGMVELLDGLHKAKDSDGDPRYQRIILVAHSLGAYIAYDGIAYLWTRMNKLHAGAHKQEPPPPPDPSNTPDGLTELEAAAQVLLDAEQMGRKATTQQVKTYREAQRNLWLGLRKNGNPWIITDFVTAGTPMYMADRIYTKNEKEFRERASLTDVSGSSRGCGFRTISKLSSRERRRFWRTAEVHVEERLAQGPLPRRPVRGRSLDQCLVPAGAGVFRGLVWRGARPVVRVRHPRRACEGKQAQAAHPSLGAHSVLRLPGRRKG